MLNFRGLARTGAFKLDLKIKPSLDFFTSTENLIRIELNAQL